MSLTNTLRHATRERHQQVEHHPFMQRLVSGKLSPLAYVDYLRSLYCAYEVLESHLLKAQQTGEPWGKLYDSRWARRDALKTDIAAFSQSPKDPETCLAQTWDSALNNSRNALASAIAIAYLRYLGDLAGGQMVRHILFRQHPDWSLSFYDFSPHNGKLLVDSLRQIIDQLGDHYPDQQAAIVCATEQGFDAHLHLFGRLNQRNPSVVTRT